MLRYSIIHHRRVFALMAISLLLAAFFAYRILAEIIYFADPRHQNQTIEPWMTMRYVSLSHSIPPEYLEELFDLGDESPGPTTIRRIMRVNRQDLNTIVSEIDAAKARHEADREKRKQARQDRREDASDD